MGYNYHNGLNALLRLAQEECDALKADLADLRAAQKAAKQSLDNMGAALDEMGRFRQQKLKGMLSTFAQAEAEASEKLRAVRDEMEKLSGLVDQDEAGILPIMPIKRTA
ncbi:hypothetical protein [Hyphococcus sp. DH-69]|uniref:hypothetical protein n=1 Tax=Hyphococcus formosus TaxID=3143534 RepID=UPI00398ADE61